MSAISYLDAVRTSLDKIQAEQLDNIQAAAGMLAEAIGREASLYSFGASHSFMITEELVYRTGGLMLINPIYPHGMNLNVKPITLTSRLERVVGLGTELLAQSAAKQGDLLLITSNSGRNPVAIDMAMQARATGILTIAITSLAYLDKAASRHPSGKKLAELCDLVIDNGTPYGDAAAEIPGFPQKVGPLSTIAGCAIANAIVAELVRELVKQGIEPPVYRSANIEGGDEHNTRLLAQYRERIHFM